MQEIFPNQKMSYENMDSINKQNHLRREVIMEDELHCLGLAINVPDWQIEFLYNYELYNQLYQSIGILPFSIIK